MKYFLLLTFSILLFSCKNENKLGLEIQPDSALINYIISDSFTLKAKTILDDSVATDITNTNLLGSYVDPVFGKSQANIITNLRLEIENPNFITEENSTFDSAFLSLYIVSGYKNSTLNEYHNQSFKVYRLNEDILIDKNNSLYSNQHIDVSSLELIGYGKNIPINIDSKDSIEILGVKEPRQIRIKLDQTKMSEIFNQRQNYFTTNENFQSKFKGIIIIPDNKFTTGEGGILTASMVSSFSKITFFYTNANGNTETYNLQINEDCNHYNTFIHDYTGTPIKSVLNDFSQGENRLYLQNNQGVVIQIKIPYLKSFFNNNQNIIINEAKLVFNIDDELSENYTKNKRIFSLVKDNTDSTYLTIDYYEGLNHVNGNLNSKDLKYEIIVTRQIQYIFKNYNLDLDKNYDLIIIGLNRAYNSERCVFYGTNPHEESEKAKKVKLKIIYTKI